MIRSIFPLWLKERRIGKRYVLGMGRRSLCFWLWYDVELPPLITNCIKKLQLVFTEWCTH